MSLFDLGEGPPCQPGDATHQSIRDEGGWPFCDFPERPDDGRGQVAGDCPKCLMALKAVAVTNPGCFVRINGNGVPDEHLSADDFLAEFGL